MKRYIAQRTLLAIPVVLGVSILIFFMVRVLPGDVATARLGDSATPADIAGLRARLGLDRPLHVQYAEWIAGVVSGNPGVSLWTDQPIGQMLTNAIPVTVELTLLATFISLLIGIPAGVLSAIYQDRPADYLARLIGIAGLAIPNFWLGTLLVILPSIWFGWIPPVQYVPLAQDPWVNLQQFILPAIALGAYLAAIVTRLTRSSLLEVLRQDYVRTARAKGLTERLVINRHAFRNAVIPVTTLAALQFGQLLGGTVIIERIFSLPGLGRLTVDAMLARDYLTVQTNVFLLAAAFALVNLIVDLSYGALDPRIRLS
ncbi:MAG: ABC transporter permease [Chloroflexi bacterium]|nr:ABC transporter permease [Chloroflexota bacterium]